MRIDDLDGVTHAMCANHWQHELLADDVNLFRDLARAESPAAALRLSVEDPEHSGRYRRFLRPLGFDDELRAVLRVGGAPWGTITLWRREGRPHFTPRETAVLAALSAPIGEALRRHARPSEALGVLLFNADGDVLSVNEEARVWLAELPARARPTDRPRRRRAGVDADHDVPRQRRAPRGRRRHRSDPCPHPERAVAGVPRLLPARPRWQRR